MSRPRSDNEKISQHGLSSDNEEKEDVGERTELADSMELNRSENLGTMDSFADDSFGMNTEDIKRYLDDRGIDSEAEEKVDSDHEEVEHKAGERLEVEAPEKTLTTPKLTQGNINKQPESTSQTNRQEISAAITDGTEKAAAVAAMEEPTAIVSDVLESMPSQPADILTPKPSTHRKAPDPSVQPAQVNKQIAADPSVQPAQASKKTAPDPSVQPAQSSMHATADTSIQPAQVNKQAAADTSVQPAQVNKQATADTSIQPAQASKQTAADPSVQTMHTNKQQVGESTASAPVPADRTKPVGSAPTTASQRLVGELLADAKTDRAERPASRFKKNREAAEATGNLGGGLVPTLVPDALSLKLQAAWRGKQDRRKLKVNQLSALCIQRLVRGLLVRQRSSAQLRRHRERIEAEQRRKTRLAHIRSKEKDLALLSTIPADQYVGFERLRREHSARAIQRNWRAVQAERAEARAAAEEAQLDDWIGDDLLLGMRATTSADVRKFPRTYTGGRAGKPSYTPHGAAARLQGISSSLLGNAAASEESALQEQKAKLKAHLQGCIQESVAEQKRAELFAMYKAAQDTHSSGNASPARAEAKGWKRYEVEVEALALAQLQRRVRESAHTRTRQQDVRAAKHGFRGATAGQGRAGADVSQSFDARHRAGTGDGCGGAPRWGARRNYQDLMEAQMQANVLLQEHSFALPHITERQQLRHQRLGNCQHLLRELQTPLSLDDARAFIKQTQAQSAGTQAAVAEQTAVMDPELQKRAGPLLVDEELWRAGSAQQGPHVTVPAPGAVEFATSQHVNALYALRTSSITHGGCSAGSGAVGRKKHWGAVALPLPLHVVTVPTASTTGTEASSSENNVRSSGDWKDLRGSINRSIDAETAKPTAGAAGMTSEGLSQRLLTDAKLFRPLASQWAKGSDVEDSLYWIAYATQPSNITPQPAQPAAAQESQAEGAPEQADPVNAPGSSPERAGMRKDYEELRHRIAVEAMGLSQRVPRVRRQCAHEQERISRLAEVYQAEMFAYLKREHALSAQHLLGGERLQQQHRAACRIQAVARGISARTRVAAARAQQRVMAALQNLLHEIAASDGGAPPPPLPRPYIGSAQQHAQPPQRGSAMFNSLLSGLSGLAPQRSAVGSGHSAASSSRASSSILAGLAIGQDSAAAASQGHTGQRMGATNLSALTQTPGTRYGVTVDTHATLADATPRSADRAGAATSGSSYALQSLLPPTNKQYTAAAHSGARDLVSNVSQLSVQVPQSTPSYFSPMMHGLSAQPDSARSDPSRHDSRGAQEEYKTESRGGIATTPSSRSAGSIISRGAWNTDASTGKRHGTGKGSSGSESLGHSSPSRQTFGILNASFSAADQLPDESLQLSRSLTSSGGMPFSPLARSGGLRKTGVGHTTGAAVTFSLEEPGLGASSPYRADNSIPSGNQLRRSEEGTPQRSAADTPGSPGSAVLSEFSFVHDEDAAPGAAYISSPGHSLSRSLSASFGQVSDGTAEDAELSGESGGSLRSPGRHSHGAPSPRSPASRPASAPGRSPLGSAGGSRRLSRLDEGESDEDSMGGLEIPYGADDAAGSSSSDIRGFRIHGTARAAQIAKQAALAVEEAMGAVERRFRTSSCTVGGFIASSLAADVRNFDKPAALIMLQNLAMVTGVSPLLRWLQRFRFDPQQLAADPESLSATPSTSLVLGAGEITVPDAALLIAELATELRLMDASAPLGSAVEQEREKEMLFNLIQTCVLMKLLGAGTDSGRLRLSELGALLEDAWLLVVPVNGVRVSQLLAQLRFCLLQQATRKACHPRKLLDDAIRASAITTTARAGEDYLSSHSVAVLAERLFSSSPSFGAFGANQPLCQELAQALVRFTAWDDTADTISLSDLRSSLCSLCSFRVLQKRLQVWFRAVPNMHPSLLRNVAAALNAEKGSRGMVSVEVFVRSSEASGVPLSQSECFMLAQLLTRTHRGPGQGGQPAAGAAYVDVALLQRIKTGDFLHAALV